jgi:hypothetical protein
VGESQWIRDRGSGEDEEDVNTSWVLLSLVLSFFFFLFPDDMIKMVSISAHKGRDICTSDALRETCGYISRPSSIYSGMVRIRRTRSL